VVAQSTKKQNKTSKKNKQEKHKPKNNNVNGQLYSLKKKQNNGKTIIA